MDIKKDSKDIIEVLVKKAKNATTPEDAIGYSQAACNCADALRTVLDIEHSHE